MAEASWNARSRLEEVDLLTLLENNFVFERIQKGQPLQLRDDIKEPNKGGHTIKIFLASSAELAPEREKIEIAINRKNKELHEKGIFLHLAVGRWPVHRQVFPLAGQLQRRGNGLRCICLAVLFKAGQVLEGGV